MHPKYRLFYLTVPNMIGLVRGNEINHISPGQTTLDGKCNKAAALSEANRENPVFITLTCFSYDVTNFSGTCASGNSLAKAKLNNVPTNVRLSVPDSVPKTDLRSRDSKNAGARRRRS